MTLGDKTKAKVDRLHMVAMPYPRSSPASIHIKALTVSNLSRT